MQGYASIPGDVRAHLEGVLETMRNYAETKTGVKIDVMPLDDDLRMKCAMILLSGSVLSAVVFGPGRRRLVQEGTIFFAHEKGPQWWRDASNASAKAMIVIVRSGLLKD